MCLRWQVAIVHNVLMLTKCHFDPWRRPARRRAAPPESLSKQSRAEAPVGTTADGTQEGAGTVVGLMAALGDGGKWAGHRKNRE